MNTTVVVGILFSDRYKLLGARPAAWVASLGFHAGLLAGIQAAINTWY